MIEHYELHQKPIDALDISYNVPNGVRTVIVAIDQDADAPQGPRSALVAYKLIDAAGNVATPQEKHVRSPHVGFFFYLDSSADEGGSARRTIHEFSVPVGVVRIELKGRTWGGAQAAPINDTYIVGVGDDGLRTGAVAGIPQWILNGVSTRLHGRWESRFTDRGPVEPGNTSDQSKWAESKEIIGTPLALDANRDAYRSHGPKEAHKFKVALICDEFTFNSFSPEFDYVILEPDTWQERIEEHQPDFLFCESAWTGVDPVKRPWRGQVYASVKFRWENRANLLKILAYCKDRSIPTVFWNKEDPTHFHDRVNDFVSTASRFDYILTTAEEMVSEYRKFHPDPHVGVLQFAAQPRDFNPLGGGERVQQAVFAGAWYDVHDERSAAMRKGFDEVLGAGIPLVIHDRNKRTMTRETNFPPPYSNYVRPAMSHKATARLYKSSTLGLNFNTVVSSGTMFARRVFELAASGTAIISNYSPGIDRIYSDDVLFYDKSEIRLSEISQNDITTMSRSTLRETLARHTYRQRFEQILTHLGLEFTSSRPAPTMMTIISSIDEAQKAVNAFNSRVEDFSRLLLVVSRDVPSSLTGQFLEAFSGPKIDVISQQLVATEKVPSTNFVTTPDIIWVEGSSIPSASDIESLLLHGEYSRLPMLIHGGKEIVVSAGALGPGMRLAAIDVIEAITGPDHIHSVLKVTR